jgi:hypothetical protein
VRRLLTLGATSVVRYVAASQPALAPYRFRIEGHTDTVGAVDHNKQLSNCRAGATEGHHPFPSRPPNRESLQYEILKQTAARSEIFAALCAGHGATWFDPHWQLGRVDRFLNAHAF